jgi:uncharacterized protein (TIRG00374 family)
MKKEIRSKIAQVTRWLIVVAIFVVIFRSIDWHRFVSVLTQANLWLVLAGIVYYPLVILMGAVRWHTILRAYHAERVHYAASLKDYWSGLAIGVFAPASLGWDVYRVAVATRRYGNVIANSTTIIVEKIMALLTCASLVTLLVPFMDIAADNRELQQIIKTTHIVLVGTLVVLATAFLMARHGASRRFFQNISARLIQWLDRLSQRKNLSASQKIPLVVTFIPLRRPGLLLTVTIFSFLIQLASAAGNHIFFIAVNHDLPFLVNLFVVPILYFVFLLPISFGSLGIREGAYILLYGAFGVPMETALLVSFFNLFGVLLNNLIGGIILVLNPKLRSHTQSTR